HGLGPGQERAGPDDAQHEHRQASFHGRSVGGEGAAAGDARDRALARADAERHHHPPMAAHRAGGDRGDPPDIEPDPPVARAAPGVTLAGARSRTWARGGRRRRLGFGLLAFGISGLVLVLLAAVLVLGSLAAVDTAASGFGRQRAELVAMIDPAASALSDVATSAANAGASLPRASDASRGARTGVSGSGAPGTAGAGSSLPIGAARLVLLGLLAWLAIPAIVSTWLGWRLARRPAKTMARAG